MRSELSRKFALMSIGLAFVFLPVLALVSAAVSSAAHGHSEKYYQKLWCDEHGGRMEVVLDDGARIDCLTDENAIEFDFGHKWAEAMGQALYYGAQTGKRAGIVLILEGGKADKYMPRIDTMIKHYQLPVDVWEMQE